MFNCQRCNQPSDPRTKQTKVVVQTRTRAYQSQVVQIGKDYFGPRLRSFAGGKGTEIVKEISICERCVECDRRAQLTSKYSVNENEKAA